MSAEDKQLSCGIDSLSDKFCRSVDSVCRYVSIAGMSCFILMLVLTFVDVLMRYFFNSPVSGSVELIEFMMVVAVFSAVGYAQITHSHVVMDIVTDSLSAEGKSLLELLSSCLSMTILICSMWAMYRYALKTPSSSPILGIPLRFFILFAVGGAGLLVLALAKDFLLSFRSCLANSASYKIVLMLVLTAGLIWLGWYIVTFRIHGMSPTAIGFLGMGVLFVLFGLGIPVPFALMMTGFVFMAAIRGPNASLNMLGKAWYGTVGSYTWAPLLFFMFMGYLCCHAKFGEDIYLAARNSLGHLRGGLAICSVCACALLGAVVGDNLAGSIVMAAIALPEMRAARYEDTLSVGTLACSGTLGCLIPPSTTFIIYAVLAEQSVADMFMAGVFPGILCTICFVVGVWFMVWRRPGLAPLLPRVSAEERRTSALRVIPILSIFIIVIGGIYAGIFTATEGGAIGGMSVLVLALIMRRLTWKSLFDCLADTSRATAMSFSVLGGATVLGYLMTVSRIPSQLASTISGLQVPELIILLAIILALFVLGCFIPAMPLMLICIPIFVPIAKMYQWDLVWFGVIMALMFNMASITPPFGINLFVMKGLASVSLNRMFKGAMPFCLMLFVCIAIIIACPSIATFLPNILK